MEPRSAADICMLYHDGNVYRQLLSDQQPSTRALALPTLNRRLCCLFSLPRWSVDGFVDITRKELVNVHYEEGCDKTDAGKAQSSQIDDLEGVGVCLLRS